MDPLNWGARDEELRAAYACDDFVDANQVLFRAVSVDAPPEIVFRWICQLKVAPYSYDWLDNYGRKSPRTLTPGNDQLEVGQRMMRIFRLVDFTPGRQLTLQLDRATRLFGELACTYAAVPDGEGTRLVCKLAVRQPPTLWGSAARRWLPWGDLVMMRRQLLNLKERAERWRDSGD